MRPPPENVARLLGRTPGLIWLDGGRNPEGWSVLAWDPVEVVTDPVDWPETGRRLSHGPDVGDIPFGGGCIGYLGYGAGHVVESVPPQAPTPEPPVWLGHYEGGLCFRHRDGTWHPAGTASFRASASRLLERAARLGGTGQVDVGSLVREQGYGLPATGYGSGPDMCCPEPGALTPRLQFEASVRRVLEWLHDGDCYQVNLARAVHLPACDPWQAYQRLRQRSAPSYGAFLVLDDGEAVLCNSPELFLEVDGDRICTEPIKGTRPRSDDPIQDAAHFRALEQSPKERAELAMIVDLVRSDLGRVAQVGSVRWGPRRIRSHRHVHHASQPIEALLAKGADAWDALAATFPPGSVTGAPKVRACHRIQELEPTPRGVYCGTIGFARPGRAVFNVAIRTAVQSAGQLRYHVGGGVVAASEPTAEWWETVHKGRALAWALGDPDAYS